jgi:hypothetical protein
LILPIAILSNRRAAGVMQAFSRKREWSQLLGLRSVI